MAKLYFRHGTVGSAKTLNLLAVAHNYRQQNKKILLLKPSLDTRFGKGQIRSRAGLEMDADVLIIDEVLGVGDMAFAAKCRERILEFRRAGKTLLCVSHSTQTLMDLCDRAIWLDHGQLIMDGPVGQVLQAYEGRPLHAPSE